MEAYSVIWNIVLVCLMIVFGVALLAFFMWAVIVAIAVYFSEKQGRELRKKRNTKHV